MPKDGAFELIPRNHQDELLFTVSTPIGFDVYVTRRYWEFIVSVKHPVMKGHEAEVKETLGNPDEIRQSKSDSMVYLFYKSHGMKRWVCAVAKRMDEEGFLVTVYPADAIKEGVRVWPK